MLPIKISSPLEKMNGDFTSATCLGRESVLFGAASCVDVTHFTLKHVYQLWPNVINHKQPVVLIELKINDSKLSHHFQFQEFQFQKQKPIYYTCPKNCCSMIVQVSVCLLLSRYQVFYICGVDNKESILFLRSAMKC